MGAHQHEDTSHDFFLLSFFDTVDTDGYNQAQIVFQQKQISQKLWTHNYFPNKPNSINFKGSNPA